MKSTKIEQARSCLRDLKQLQRPTIFQRFRLERLTNLSQDRHQNERQVPEVQQALEQVATATKLA